MKISKLKNRMRKDRPMTTVTLRMPGDIVDDLKRMAPILGFSGYQPLMRHYIGRALRTDLERLDSASSHALIESLKRHGVDEAIIAKAVEESAQH